MTILRSARRGLAGGLRGVRSLRQRLRTDKVYNSTMNGKNLAAAMAAKRQMNRKGPKKSDADEAACMADGGIVEQGDHADDPSPSRAGRNEPDPSAFPREEAYAMADAIMAAKSYRTSTSQADHYAKGGNVEPHKAGLQSEPNQDMDDAVQGLGSTIVGPDGRRRFGAMPSSIGPNGDSALMLSRGGRIDEHSGEDLTRTDGDENRQLAMKDTYPSNKEESDTMAQDESFGDGPLKNEDGDQDQEAARKAMRKNRLGGIMSDMRQRHFGKP